MFRHTELMQIAKKDWCVHCGKGGNIKKANLYCPLCCNHVHRKCAKDHAVQFAEAHKRPLIV